MAAAREIPDKKTQRKEIKRDMKKPLRKRDTWYLVDCRWFRQWKKFVGFDSRDQSGAGDEQNNPGPIDNSCLFQADASTLKENLIHVRDYNLLPKEGWFKLVSWYGVTSDQQALPRNVIDWGVLGQRYRKKLSVEVYLTKFELLQNSDPKTLITGQFSRVDTVGHVVSEMKKVFNIPQDTETRVWSKYRSHTRKLLTNLEETVQDADLYQGQVLVIEQKNEDGTWPMLSLQPSFWEMLRESLMDKQKENNSETKKAAAKKASLKRNDIVEPKPMSNDSSRSSESLRRHSHDMEEQSNHFQEQLKEKEERVTNLLQQLTATDINLQKRFDKMERELRNCKEQLQAKNGQLNYLQGQLGEKEELKTKLESTERELKNCRDQLLEKQDQSNYLQEKLRGKEEQLREIESLRRELTERDRQAENLRRQLNDKEVQLTNLRADKEKARVKLEKELRDREQDIVTLERDLSTAKKKLVEYESQLKQRDWVISRDDIQITDACLGEGGWGRVVKGWYCGCAVAVKYLHKSTLTPQERTLFEREMDIASRCRHPCLLQFIGATKDEKSSPLFVTELMETSLRVLLAKRKLSEAEITVISLDVARALNYLHQRKPIAIVHRDVSSANVLLWRHRDQWRGKVSDYGTAKFVQGIMTVAPGALIYSAPEAGVPYNQTVKIDVYSLGVLLCEMCIDEFPDPDKRDEQVAKVENREFRSLILWCLEEDAEMRPDMEQVIEKLDKFNTSQLS